MCVPVPATPLKEWQHAGLNCAIVKNHFGAFCAYVRIPPGHPDYGKDYDDVDVTCHGGLTFGEKEKCVDPTEHKDGIGHWFGMDYAHAWDYNPEWENQMAELCPSIPRQPKQSYQHEWTLEEVVAECNELADQFKARGLKKVIQTTRDVSLEGD